MIMCGPLNGKRPQTQTTASRGKITDPIPYFHDDKYAVRLYLGDCLDILTTMPDECVDLIFADPPYFLSNSGITCHAGKMVSVNKGEYGYLLDSTMPHRLWFDQC